MAIIRIRLSVSRKEIYYGKTNISIHPDWWNTGKEEIKSRLLLPEGVSRDALNNSISKAKELVSSYYASHKGKLSGDWINMLLSGRMPENKDKSFFSIYENFIEDKKVSPGRRKHFKVLCNDLKRFSAVTGLDLSLDGFSQVAAFESFLRDEHNIQDLHESVYLDKKEIKPRGQNTINAKLKILSGFFSWCRDKKLTRNNPFDGYQWAGDVYGDPVPLLVEEVEILLNLSNLTPLQEKVRDMFCLQCFTGCRIGDFMSLKRENLTDDILSYIPEKTISDNPRRVYVPLPDRALRLIDKFSDPEGHLVPRLNVNGKSGYNKIIKKVFEIAGLTRPVTVINTVTRKPEISRLCDIVTSHTARKTFINSNYLETQDPNLISMMSGHSQNSRAFARYRNIDVDLLRKQIKKTFG